MLRIKYHVCFCLLAVFFAFFSHQLIGQPRLEWSDLTNISFMTYQDRTAGIAYMKPIFQEKVMKLNKQEISITGYMIPLDVEGYQYVLSAYPNASCFFCGGAGKESVIEIFLKNFDKRYEIDEIVTLKGVLELNDGEMGLCYKLNEAEEVK
ncbi:MAG: DUF3299 domain-containing protein [Bacteroidota bacterium]